MTKQEYTNLMGRFPVRFAMAMCENNQKVMTMEERIERYGNPKEWTGFSNEKGHIMYVGKMANLFRRAVLMGATKDELADIWNQLMIGTDAMKHRLNYKQAEEDHHIPALKEKYSMKNFMAHNASEFQDQLLNWN